VLIDHLGVAMQPASRGQCQLALPLPVVKYAVEQNRDGLVRLLNSIIGPPTVFGHSLQTAFVSGEMAAADMTEFASVCLEIIDTKSRIW
jgi:hypothetical protein